MVWCDILDRLSLKRGAPQKTRKAGHQKKDRAPEKGDEVVVFWEKEKLAKTAKVMCVTEQKGEFRRDV